MIVVLTSAREAIVEAGSQYIYTLAVAYGQKELALPVE